MASRAAVCQIHLWFWRGYWLWPCVCVTCRCSIETDEWIELVFGKGTSLHLSYPVLKRNSRIFKIRAISSGTLSKTYIDRLKTERSWKTGPSTVERRSSEVLSTKLTSELRRSTTSSSQVIVNLCLRHDFVEWVKWWQLIPVLPSSLTQSVIHVPWSVNAMEVITDVSVIHIVHTVSYSEFYLDFQISKRVCVPNFFFNLTWDFGAWNPSPGSRRC